MPGYGGRYDPPPAATERDGRSSTAAKPNVLSRADERGHSKRENGTSVRSVNGRSDGTPAIGASMTHSPNPLGTFSTNSRCTTLPRRGTTRGTARPRPVHNAFIAAVMGSEKNIGTSILDVQG